jgi:hypothetical protein
MDFTPGTRPLSFDALPTQIDLQRIQCDSSHIANPFVLVKMIH